jgi:alkyl hydroperoxide reductase subunit AhpC
LALALSLTPFLSCTLLLQANATQPAPDFNDINSVMPDGSFKKLSLKDFRGKYLVLFSYPLDFTFVCPTEICGFSDAMDRFGALDCAVVGFSLDSVFCHNAWRETPRKEGGIGPIKYPLLADIHRQVSADYGCLIEGDDPLSRCLFIIDDKGVVRYISRQHPPVGRNVDEVLRLVEAYQFTDKHGEVCPLGWHKGDKTIVPGTKSKLAYFEKVADSGSNGSSEASPKRQRKD